MGFFWRMNCLRHGIKLKAEQTSVRVTIRTANGSTILEQFTVGCDEWQPHKVAAEIRGMIESEWSQHKMAERAKTRKGSAR